MDPPSLRYWQQKMFFFKVYEEVLGLLDFLHFFGITFTLEDETPLIDFQIKKTNPTPGLLFQTQKKQVVSKWAGLKNKTKTSIIPWKKKTTIHPIYFLGGTLFFGSYLDHLGAPMNLRFAQNRHPPIRPSWRHPASLGQRVDLRSPPRGFLGKTIQVVGVWKGSDGFVGFLVGRWFLNMLLCSPRTLGK